MSNASPPDPFALDQHIQWAGSATAGALRALPARPAVYQLESESAACLLLATTQSLRAAVTGRLSPDAPRHPGRADLNEIVRGVRWQEVSGTFEARWKHYRILRARGVADYRSQMGFGSAWFLHIDFAAEIPDLRVTDRIFMLPGEFVGPFPTQRQATAVLEGLWDLFDLCRYPAEVARAPHGRRCAYAEMGRCDAPCDGGAPLEAYAGRVQSAWRFVCGGVSAWLEDAAGRMQQAAQELRFEAALLVKRQREWGERFQAEWDAGIRHGTELQFLIVASAARRREARLMLFREGVIEEGPMPPHKSLEGAAAGWVGAQVAGRPPETPESIRMEQTWLLAQLLERAAGETVAVLPLQEDGLGDTGEAALRAFCNALRSRKRTTPAADVEDDRGGSNQD